MSVTVHVIQDLMEPLQHFCHPEHPLVLNQNNRSGEDCYGCWELVLGPSYSCIKCKGYVHHKSCAELPLGLDHPLHPLHSLILCDEWKYKNDKEFSKCNICKENHSKYTYLYSRCDFNLHVGCASLLPTLEAEFHDHPWTPIWKWITSTCNLCGIKEEKGMPYLCNPCGFSIHRKCAYFPRRLKVVHHKHPFHITHSSLKLHESDSQFCLLCVQKVDTHYELY